MHKLPKRAMRIVGEAAFQILSVSDLALPPTTTTTRSRSPQGTLGSFLVRITSLLGLSVVLGREPFDKRSTSDLECSLNIHSDGLSYRPTMRIGWKNNGARLLGAISSFSLEGRVVLVKEPLAALVKQLRWVTPEREPMLLCPAGS